jgi:uncharacterized protein (DUF2235 family)
MESLHGSESRKLRAETTQMEKRLVYCFDGTWNTLDAAHPTNVLLTAQSVLPLTQDVSQFIYYDEGVGTGGNVDYWTGGVLGEGLLQNLSEAYQNLIFNYTPGDEIFVFGFSRGAFTARSFCGLLSNSGILDRRHASKAREAVELYRSRDTSATYLDQVLCFRRDNCADTLVSQEEHEWRQTNCEGYTLDETRRIGVKYLGVWDTVGALGVPKSFLLADKLNKKYEFHDTALSDFVKSARHAVAINEMRADFEPTLWGNLAALNQAAGSDPADVHARYQQKWFPGVHSSVGGGANQRGLSDQALLWIWIGAMQAGLHFDTSQHSRIFELAPKFSDKLVHSDDPGFAYNEMVKHGRSRLPGPAAVHEVSLSAQRRWHEDPSLFPEKQQYRPGTLQGVSKLLGALDPMSLGVGAKYREMLAKQEFATYTVQRGDGLRAIAKRFYGKASDADRIFDVNRDVLEHPDLIFAEQGLRLPKAGLLDEQTDNQQVASIPSSSKVS